MEIFIWATDKDNALELAGNGAAPEYTRKNVALDHNPSDEGEFKLFRITVEWVDL